MLQQQYDAFKAQGLKLDMSRGKPSPEQLDLALPMLSINDYKDDTGADARNYSHLEGLPEARRFFADLQGVTEAECFVGGNSSLELMFHCVNIVANSCGTGKHKWLCPVPGYDRHFRVTERFGYEMISVPMLPSGPDMGVVEQLVRDPDVCGIWCVPVYSNPDGYTYSDEVVKRLASMQTANAQFRIFWDNAYGFHHIYDEPSRQAHTLNILTECKAAGNADRSIMFCSTSKITFAGAGVAAIGASADNIKFISDYLSAMTIGFDKMNQLRHVRFLKNEGGLALHMQKHAAILRPKFEVVDEVFTQELSDGTATWTRPYGGYFISLYTKPGVASKAVQLCKDAGVVLTGAGAAFPYGKDPDDRHIRVAPSYPSVDELRTAARLLALSVKLCG